jgi:CheY-like chemotaxis protein
MDVLVVEDGDRLRGQIAELLRREGARVTTVKEGIEALHVCADPYALILVGPRVQDMGRDDLIRRIRSLAPRAHLVKVESASAGNPRPADETDPADAGVLVGCLRAVHDTQAVR